MLDQLETVTVKDLVNSPRLKTKACEGAKEQYNQLLIGIKDVCRLLNVCDKTVFRWLKDEGNGFPRPVKLPSVKKILWRMSDIVNYIESLGVA